MARRPDARACRTGWSRSASAWAARARVLLVSTHADEDRRGYRIDYTGLKEQFGDMLVGQLEVDSRSGKGFNKLKRIVAKELVRLPHVGEPISRRWMAAQEELLKHRPQASASDVGRDC